MLCRTLVSRLSSISSRTDRKFLTLNHTYRFPLSLHSACHYHIISVRSEVQIHLLSLYLDYLRDNNLSGFISMRLFTRFIRGLQLQHRLGTVTDSHILTCVLPSPESQHMIVFRDESFCVLKFGAFFSPSLRGTGEITEEPKPIISAQLYSGDVITLLLRSTEQTQQVVLAQFPLNRIEDWRPVSSLQADWRFTAVDAG